MQNYNSKFKSKKEKLKKENFDFLLTLMTSKF